MVELILVSVGVFSVVIFLLNVRAGFGKVADERPLLDGDPKWVDGTLQTVIRRAEYLGMTVADIALELGGKPEEMLGLIPPAYESQITGGLNVRGHVEYDVLDTIQTGLWDHDPNAVLAVCAAKLNVEPTFDDEHPGEFTFTRNGHEITVMLPFDGWATIIIPPGVGGNLSVDLRYNFDEAENARMLTERLGVTRDQADLAGEFLDALRPDTLQRIEAFAAVEGWTMIESDGIEFELALPFPEGELMARIVDESLAIAALIHADVAAQDEDEPVGDGAW